MYTLDGERQSETAKHNMNPGGAREGSGGVLPKGNLLDGRLRDVGGRRADPVVHVY